tara:strand:+ start:144 stop:371 length:228 start_codon:yes stop_codon:yes gene_type:complete
MRKYNKPKDAILKAMQRFRRQTGRNASVRDLASMTGQSKSNVQQHLVGMWKAGKASRSGTGRRCWRSNSTRTNAE